jgi:hypothetical protein
METILLPLLTREVAISADLRQHTALPSVNSLSPPALVDSVRGTAA